jgi:hypothetical protein
MININFFSHHGRNHWKLHNYFFNKLDSVTKSKVTLNILESSEPRSDYGFEGFNVNVFRFNFPPNNYLDKVHWSIHQATPYTLKLDDDVFWTTSALEFAINNLELLISPKYLMIVPAMANGTPHCDWWINSFCNREQQSELHKLFLEVRSDRYYNGIIPHFGVQDDEYLKLNEYGLNTQRWNHLEFQKIVSSLKGYYRGTHPIRINETAQRRSLDFILDNWDRFNEPQQHSMMEIDYAYFCNGSFLTKTSHWRNAVLDESLSRDTFDEVNLNLYKDLHKLKVLAIPKGWAFHLFYNTVNNHKELEKQYYNKFMEKING